DPGDGPGEENIIPVGQAGEGTVGGEYFPRQMSWYAPEGPQGWMEEGSRKVREHPWLAIGVAGAGGWAVGMLAKPLIRAGISMAMKQSEPEAEGEEPEAASDCGCCDEE